MKINNNLTIYNINKNTEQMPLSFKGVDYSYPKIVDKDKGSNTVKYCSLPNVIIKDGKTNVRKLSFLSYLLRDDVIKHTPKYINERFPNGATIVIGASSFGHEPITMGILSDKLNVPIIGKIKAIELNKTASKISSMGVIEASSTKNNGDLTKLRAFLGDDITDCLEPASDEEVDNYVTILGEEGLTKNVTKPKEDEKVILITKQRENSKENYFVKVNKNRVNKKNIYKVSDKILNKITFINDDFNNVDFPTNKPTLVMFRNCMMHFRSDERKNFLDNLYTKIPKGSSLIVARGDLTRGVGKYIIDAGFEPKNKKLNLSTINADWKKYNTDPETFIFEKN